MEKKRPSKEQYVSLIKFEVEIVFFFKDRSAWNVFVLFFASFLKSGASDIYI